MVLNFKFNNLFKKKIVYDEKEFMDPGKEQFSQKLKKSKKKKNRNF